MALQPNLQIRRQILRTILDGNYRPGMPLPTIQEMARTFKVSNKTVQKAIHMLREEGVIETKRGVGLFVKKYDPQAVRGKRIGLVHLSQADAIEKRHLTRTTFECLRECVAEEGYSLVQCPLVDVSRLMVSETIQGLNLSGLLLFEVDNDSLISEIRELRLPMVSMDYDAYRHGISSVTFDNNYGTLLATQHLIKNGHDHIVFLRPLIQNAYNNCLLDAVEEERLKGYRMAMMSAGLPTRIVEYDNTKKQLQGILLSLLGRRPSPSAFVCVADWAAGLAARETQRLGYRIPEDISIVGFGNDENEYEPNRRITTVTIDCEGMARESARIIMATMRGEQKRPERVYLHTELAEYESVENLNVKANAPSTPAPMAVNS